MTKDKIMENMRLEILFRGKRVDNGQWVYGWYCKYAFGRWPIRACIIPSEEAENGCVEHVEIDPATVSQYINLTDENGVKIFDGDILKSGYELFVVKYGHCGGVQNVEHEVGYVGFYLNPCGKDAEKLLSYGMRTDILYWLNSLKLEVSGNIHDNPELLDRGGRNL